MRKIKQSDELKELFLVLSHYTVTWVVLRGGLGNGSHLVNGFVVPDL